MSAAGADESSEDLSELVQDDEAEEEADDATETTEEPIIVKDADTPCIVWCGPNKKFPIFIFSPHAVERRDPQFRSVGEKYHMAFKIIKTDCKLLKTILVSHGFHETHPNSSDFNLMWTGSHLKPYVLRSLSEFQKVNHFPRSYELTRKDRLYKNVQRLQQLKGVKHFDFVPPTFIFPAEFQEFCTYYLKDKGPFIVKPIASSRGRGIFIATHPDQIPLDDQLVVCKYVANPLVVDGFKFDLRIYVAVTSYDPLVIYMYEEGLARFATVKYQAALRYSRNQCMHLTNYSVNKKNQEYVQNDDADVEDYGNKWSLGALLRYLKSEGHDTSALMMRLEDVIVKAILSVEMPIASACKMFQPHKGNCFELYGFDIIIDDTLRPWLLEVNLSPSLACDSPLDFKIKCHMLSDLLSLVGFVCHDPMLRQLHTTSGRATAAGSGSGSRDSPVSAARSRQAQMSRPGSASSLRSLSATRLGGWHQQQGPLHQRQQSSGPAAASAAGAAPPLSAEEVRMIRRCREEFHRRGGWLRIFPTPDSWEAYSGFLQTLSPNNLLLHQRLFPNVWRQAKSTPQASGAKCKVPLHSLSSDNLATVLDSHSEHHRKVHRMYRSASQRTLFYERKLGASSSSHGRQRSRGSSQLSRSQSLPPKRPAVFGPHAQPEASSGAAS
ncbi:hypothetical protein BOX15_Mlig027105g2 [Macrostomum lignano]|uniref:Tubulin--tyrosine ligase-like protein 5 n=1 Tax=Macrostomum lignano TaxID=282301 RepID=A0A267DE65_9PLAT|nr:hypothetical protein BOX15_Mlig027105g2 [Macrostomum lignano]